MSSKLLYPGEMLILPSFVTYFN